ncbi:MAG: hypothetical protein HY748_01955 [Elusimicrobia bacterium]|nr:hypothetical protein [Elusimicrobiota bacterium]
MDGRSLDALRRWAARWAKAGPELERIRADELGRVDDAFLSALRHSPARRSSGLVEQQRWFARLRD